MALMLTPPLAGGQDAAQLADGRNPQRLQDPDEAGNRIVPREEHLAGSDPRAPPGPRGYQALAEQRPAGGAAASHDAATARRVRAHELDRERQRTPGRHPAEGQ